jgi:glyoxylase-like metal-dependent hydrolase (beta-lactamase superfamily II)
MRLLLLAGTALLSATMTAAVPAQTPPPASGTAAVDVAPFVAHEITPRIHLLSTPEDYFGPAIGNVTLIEQRDGFVLVDSGLNAGNGRAVVRYARSLSPKPIKAVMITHWHNDHPQGISAIRDAFPKVRIIATKATEAGMLGPEAFDIGYSPGPKWDGAMSTLLGKNREALNKLLADPATAADRKERIKKALVQYDGFEKDFKGSYIVPPTETFERRLVIADPDVPVEIRHLGVANTEGDAIAWLPRQKIVASGDIVVAPIPFGFGSHSGAWIETIGRIKALGFTTLIPGHGQPQSDASYLDKLVAAMTDLRAQIFPLAKAGMSLDEVKKKVDFTKSIETFGTTTRIRANAASLFFDPMTGSVYKEALGQPIIQGEGSPEPDVPRDTPPKPRSKHHKS